MRYDVHVLPRAGQLTVVDTFDDLVDNVLRNIMCEPQMKAGQLIGARLRVAVGGMGLTSFTSRELGGCVFSTVRILPAPARRIGAFLFQ